MSAELPRLEREAGRLILFDQHDRVLLIRGHDTGSTDRPWWITPGGGCEPGEDHRSAAIRETLEETGLTPDWVGDSCLERTVSFPFVDVFLVQHEHLFPALITSEPRLERRHWTELEHRILQDFRWWHPRQLRLTTETIYPEQLGELASQLLTAGLGGPGLD